MSSGSKPETENCYVLQKAKILALKKGPRLENDTASYLLSVALHDVVDLLELVGKPLLARELVLLQGEDQLLVVLHRIPARNEDDEDDDDDDKDDNDEHEESNDD